MKPTATAGETLSDPVRDHVKLNRRSKPVPLGKTPEVMPFR